MKAILRKLFLVAIIMGDILEVYASHSNLITGFILL